MEDRGHWYCPNLHFTNGEMEGETYIFLPIPQEMANRKNSNLEKEGEKIPKNRKKSQEVVSVSQGELPQESI